MPSYMMVVMSKPKGGRDAEYHEWYDNTHIGDICSIPGIVAGQRWTALTELSPNPPPQPFLAIYEIEADDPSKVMQELVRQAEAGEFEMSEALDLENTSMWIYEKR